ncbi:MAG: hypothetical protein K8T90_15745 [Planctomycetes bacterium]|nr:hypothetical protein [Planctomycetota bacterium]
MREQRRGVDRALAWIASNQQSGGMWGKKDGGTRVADTALSVLALMAGGSAVGPGVPLEGGGLGPETLRGPYAKEVQAGIKYLAALAWTSERDKARGYITDDSNSKMHGHGFATLALAEACGSLGPTDVKRIRSYVAAGGDPTSLRLADQVRWALELAVDCTVRAQDVETGGWSYGPYEGGHEGSMTVTQIIALRAASEVGVRVNAATMRHAYEYVRKSQNLATPAYHGGFAYQMNMRERVSYGLTAAALTTFFGLGRYGDDKGDKDVIRFGMEYLDRNLDEVLEPDAQWFYYNLFYGSQALYMSADERRIREQWPRIRAAVLAQQQKDGHFAKVGPANDTGGEEYSTAIACLTLQVPMETLPIFQRR